MRGKHVPQCYVCMAASMYAQIQMFGKLGSRMLHCMVGASFIFMTGCRSRRQSTTRQPQKHCSCVCSHETGGHDVHGNIWRNIAKNGFGTGSPPGCFCAFFQPPTLRVWLLRIHGPPAFWLKPIDCR